MLDKIIEKFSTNNLVQLQTQSVNSHTHIKRKNNVTTYLMKAVFLHLNTNLVILELFILVYISSLKKSVIHFIVFSTGILNQSMGRRHAI